MKKKIKQLQQRSDDMQMKMKEFTDEFSDDIEPIEENGENDFEWSNINKLKI